MERAGKFWTPDEQDLLLKERISNKKSIQEIAEAHHRSNTAIELRLLDWALRQVHAGMSLQDAAKLISVSEESLKHRQEEVLKKQQRLPPKLRNQPKPHDRIVDELVSIRKILEQVLQDKPW